MCVTLSRHRRGCLPLYEEILSQPNPAAGWINDQLLRASFIFGSYIGRSIISAVMDVLGVLRGGRGVFRLYCFFSPTTLINYRLVWM